jgi:hypothetical protein
MECFEGPTQNTLYQPGHGLVHLLTQEATNKEALAVASPAVDINGNLTPHIRPNSYRMQDKFYQIWDAYLWLTPLKGGENSTKRLGWILPFNCKNIISLQANNWFATN